MIKVDRTKICFATPGVYPMLQGDYRVVGGSESRALRFINAVAATGRHGVRVIVFARGRRLTHVTLPVTMVADPQRVRVQGRLATRWRRIVRAFSPVVVDGPIPLRRWQVDAWQRADADLYVAFGVADYTAQLAAWCRSVGRPLLLMLGSDMDLSEAYTRDSERVNHYGSRNAWCRHLIDSATAVVAQTEHQAALLSRRFDREAMVLPNPVDTVVPLPSPRARVLWVGKSNPIKRPDLLVALARRLPEVPFTMVMNRTRMALADEIVAAVPANVDLVDSVAPADMPALHARSTVLVNTSDNEGMPNTFLEAAQQMTPVASLNADPDGMIAKSGGGLVAAGDFDALVNGVRQLHTDGDHALRCGAALHEFVLHHHAPALIYPRFIALIDGLTAA